MSALAAAYKPEQEEEENSSYNQSIWRETIAYALAGLSRYQSRNLEYEASIPSYVSYDNGSVYDYEPHCAGIGDFDEPDESMFQRYKRYSWETGPIFVPVIKVRSFKDILDIAMGNYEHWIDIFSPNQPPWTVMDLPAASMTKLDYSDKYAGNIIMGEGEELTSFPQPHQIRHIKADFSDFADDYSLVSATFLALLLAVPNVESLCIDKFWYNCDEFSLFADFPSPLAGISSHLDGLGVPFGFSTAEKLETLQFSNCVVGTRDVFFLGDCAIEHKVLPALRNVKMYYCNGMSYSSVLHLSPVVNLDFDRWECSGWTFPQECSNKKNRNAYM